MPLSSETSQVTYVGDGANDEFPFAYKFLVDSDLVVELAPAADPTAFVVKTKDVHYTVDGAGDEAGGTVTMVTAPAADAVLRITRTVPLTQTVDFRENGPYSPKTITRQLDKAMMAAQQLQRGIDEARADLASALADLVGANVGAAFGFLTEQAPRTDPNALQVRFRSDGHRVQVSEHGGPWRFVTGADEVRDVRDFLSDAEKTQLELGNAVNATGAMQDIFAELATGDGRIFTPFNGTLFQIEATCEYIGAASRAVNWAGDLGSSRGAAAGSGFKWVGAVGGTMFDMRGINNSDIGNLFFHGNDKAKYLLRLREYRNDDITLLASSQNVHVRRCFFVQPDPDDPDTILVPIGQTTAGNTFQASEYRFFEVVCIGANGRKSGKGIATLEAGNCKNFSVQGGFFTNLYRGIETLSGCLLVSDVLGTAIGHDQGRDAALVYTGAEAVLLNTLGLENGDNSTIDGCRLAISTNQNAQLLIDGVYFAGATPADDYAIVSAGPMSVRGAKLGPNYKQVAMNAWLPTTTYAVGQERYNGLNAYRVASITTGISAGAGGPAGTGTGIVDGGVTWDYVAPLASNTMKISGNPTGIELSNSGFVTHNANSLTTAPIYDGSGNLLTSGDYAKLSVANNKVWCRNNVSTGAPGLTGPFTNKLRDTISGHYDDIRDQILTDNNTAGVVVVSDVAGRYVVTVPYSVFATAGAGYVVIGRLNYLHHIETMIAQVTAGLSGGAVVTPQVSAGLQYGPGGGDLDIDGLLVAFAADAAATFGRLDAELGALFEARGGWVSPPDHLNEIRVKLTVGGGAIAGLSAGSITFIVAHKRMGV